MSESEAYRFRVRCDICKESSKWLDTDGEAEKWRSDHFADVHPDNPMVTQNARVQRYPQREVPA